MSTSTNFFELIQKGFHVTVGAAATLVETIQDPTKREVTIAEFRTELQSRAEEWSEKGEMTEQEARKFLEKIFQQGKAAREPGNQEIVTTATEVQDGDLQSELKNLTEQIVTLKSELAALRQNDNEPE
jgi:polyhydroxyalkanoate synthesis regulator phasin